MTERPSNNDEAEEVLQAYRRASESDRSRPSPAARMAIRARAQSTARLHPSAWKWKVAASIAVVGLVGILTSQIFRDRFDQIQEPAPSVPAAPPPAELSRAQQPKLPRSTPQPATPSIPSPTPLQTSAPRTSPLANSAGVTAAPARIASAPAPRDQQADAGVSARRPMSEAPEAKIVAAAPGLNASGAGSSLSASANWDPWYDRTLQAMRSNYPELFDASRDAGLKRIAIVLNHDGSVYRSAIDTSATTPFSRLFESLRVNSADLESAPRVLFFASSTDHPDNMYVMVGIRK